MLDSTGLAPTTPASKDAQSLGAQEVGDTTAASLLVSPSRGPVAAASLLGFPSAGTAPGSAWMLCKCTRNFKLPVDKKGSQMTSRKTAGSGSP